MGRKASPRRLKSIQGVTLPEVLGAAAILAALAAIFFPVFQKVNYPFNGAVRDGLGKPLPGAVLRFRDPAGRIIATVVSDGGGSFRRDGLDGLSHDAVDGFGLTRMGRRTGAGTLYTFSPLGTHIATFRDEAGRPVPGLAVSLAPKYYAWHRADGPLDLISDKNGTVRVPNIPVGGRFDLQSQDPSYAIGQVQTTVDGNTVRYAVTAATK